MSGALGTALDFFPLTAADFAATVALWEAAEGVVLREEDRNPQVFEEFLRRNPRLSWGVRQSSQLVGAVMAGQDGRRGYIYHLAVASSYREHGIGRALANKVQEELNLQGICRTHAQVVRRNLRAQLFWMRVGWAERDELVSFSCATEDRTDLPVFPRPRAP